jgi:hypothetical protein
MEITKEYYKAIKVKEARLQAIDSILSETTLNDKEKLSQIKETLTETNFI